MKEGFGLGIGVSIARNIVDRIMGPASTVQLTPTVSQPVTEFKKCMQVKDDYEECKIHLQ